MSNDVTELRQELFETLRALKDKQAPMDIDRAKAVVDVAQAIINSAKVEVDHMKVAGSAGSGFIPAAPPGLPSGTTLIGQKPGVTITQHKSR